MMLVSFVLGSLVGLVAGEASRGLAHRPGFCTRPDLLSLVLSTGAGLTLTVWTTPQTDLPAILLRAGVLMVLSLVLASDLRERAVYPAIVYPAIVGLALAAPLLGTSIVDAVAGGLVAGALFIVLYLVARLRYGPGALGEGDVSVAVLLGVVVGLSRLPFALPLVSIIGAGLALVAAVRARSLRASFAYAPTLCLAALATSLLHSV
jgi:prepilin signal peptidase PulO-like enzyme (type II secretory pathway)